MKYHSFQEVVYFQEGPGVRNWQFRPNGVKLINIRNIVDNNIDLSNTFNFLSEEEVESKYKHFLCNEGDYLMASSGVTWGKIAIVKNEHLPLCLNTSIIRLVSIDEGVLNKKYLYHFITSYSFTSQIEKLITGSAQPNFGPSHLRKVKIPVPALPIQHQIVSELDTLIDIITKKKQQLADLDTLAQATFYDMFGDPVNNEKGWEVKPLNKITKVGTGGTPSRTREQEFYNGNINWAKTTEVNGNYILDTEEKITDLALAESNCKVFPIGTILLAMYGQGKTRGNVGFLKIKAATNQACAAIPPNEEMNQVFLFEHLKTLYLYLRGLARGGNQENLNLNIVGNIKIILPPKFLQSFFSEKIESIEKQKQLINQSIADVQQLFDYTMDKYFN
jgi:type I restriction enzyme S subunit